MREQTYKCVQEDSSSKGQYPRDQLNFYIKAKCHHTKTNTQK